MMLLSRKVIFSRPVLQALDLGLEIKAVSDT